MSEWKEYKLEDVIERFIDYRGKTPRKTSSGIPLLTAKIIKAGRILEPNEFIATDDYQSWMTRGYPEIGDVILTTEAPLGEVAIINNNNVALGQRLITLQTKKNICNSYFLKYYLLSNDGQAALQARSSGSTVEGIKAALLKKMEVSLPPLPEQRAIAAVLSSLDDKIDLLHRQNRTLEAMAETLFRQWFIEEADEGWDTGKLPDEFDFTMGQSPVGNSFNENGVGIPMFQGNADFGFRFPTERVFTTEPKRFAEPLDTLISVRAPVGEQNMALVKCCIGRGVAAFKYSANKNYYTYTYFKLRSLMNEIKEFNNEGTVFGSIGKADFEAFNITIPPQSLIENFEQRAKQINDKVIENCYQIRTLEKLRDTLLPKLMSGEERVEI